MTLMLSTNWYDIIALTACIGGIWSGVRAGLSGELVRASGFMLMTLVSLWLLSPIGDFLNNTVFVHPDIADFFACVGISLILYLIVTGLRGKLEKKVKEIQFPIQVENIGGGLLGCFRTAALMVLLTVALCLTRSEFLHQQIGRESFFGMYVVSKFPAVEEQVNRNFEETLWFLRDIERRGEIGIDENR